MNKEINPFKFEEGEWVQCIALNPDNPEKLTEWRLYKVVGTSVVDDGNVVYALKDMFGGFFYSTSKNLERVTPKVITTDELVEVATESTYQEPIEISDPVNHPNHYTAGGIECIDYLIAKLPKDELIGYCRGNAMKYLSRVGLKDDPLQEYKKALWYINKLIEVMSESK